MTEPIRLPIPARKPTADYGSRAHNQQIEDLIRAVNTLSEQAVRTQRIQGAETTINDSAGNVIRGLFYGIGADGRIALALGGSAAVEPLFVALASAPSGAEFPIARGGRVRVVPADSSITPTAGDFGWLSDSAGGRVVTSAPTLGRYRVCKFAETRTAPDGTIAAWVTLFPQSGGTL